MPRRAGAAVLLVLGLAKVGSACGSDRRSPRQSSAKAPRVSAAEARALGLTRPGGQAVLPAGALPRRVLRRPGEPLPGRPRRETIETNGGHWHYDVSWTPAVTRLLVRRGVQRPANAGRRSACRAARLGDEDVEVCEVVPYEQGGGLHGGHVAYVWSHPPATYVVSLHGYENKPRARAMMAALVATALGYETKRIVSG